MATYQQRGNSVRVLIRPAGMKPITATFDTDQQAREWGARVEARIKAGLDPEGAPASLRTPVCELLRDYLIEYCEDAHKSARTTRNLVHGLIGRFDEFKKPLGDFSVADLERIAKARLKGDKTQGRNVLPVCDGTVRREIGILSGFYKWLIEKKGIPVPNIAKQCERPAKPEPREQRAYPEDVELMLAELGYVPGTVPETSKEWVGWSMLFGIATALRCNNVLSMKWEHYRKGGKILECPGILNKNGKHHRQPLGESARALLDLLPRGAAHDCIVPLSDSNYGKIWREARAACGLTKIRRHDLRREGITRAAQHCRNVIELQKFSGHRSLNSLQTYYQPTPEGVADLLP